MASTGQRYAVGIGTGAASGALAGSALGPWGAAIGGVVGGAGGAVSAAMGNSEEAKQRALMEAQHARSKKQILMDMLRERMQQGGLDTSGVDARMQLNDLNVDNTNDERAFQASHRIDPAAFAPIAQAGTAAAGKIYDAYNHASDHNQLQLQPFQRGAGQGNAPEARMQLSAEEF